MAAALLGPIRKHFSITFIAASRGYLSDRLEQWYSIFFFSYLKM
jgi:hypothetical protein